MHACSFKARRLHTLFPALPQALAAGTFPSHDEEGRPLQGSRLRVAGQPLAGGRRGAWVELRGDWEFLWQSLRLQQYWRTANCCHLCSADKAAPEHLYTDFRRSSRTRGTLRTHEEWSAAVEAAGRKSELTGIPGFCIWRCAFDLMHTLDLGVLQHAVPSALQELAEGIGCRSAGGPFAAATVEARMVEATRMYRDWCAANKITSKVRRITKAWVAGPYPSISQAHAKAAALRSMLYWVREVCVAEATASPHAATRAACFDSLARVDATLRRNGRFLTDASGDEVAQHTEDALLCYNALAVSSFEDGSTRWPLVPKFHALTHIMYDHMGVNPRSTHCYADEDMVGRVKRIYIQCHANSAPKRTLERYALYACLRAHQVARAAWPAGAARRAQTTAHGARGGGHARRLLAPFATPRPSSSHPLSPARAQA